MKYFTATIGMALLLVGKPLGFAQGFVNLNFEASVLTNYSWYGSIATSALVTGWTTYTPITYAGQIGISFNQLALDSAWVSLTGTNNPYGYSSIQGKYSVFLQGGSYFFAQAYPGVPGITNGASIYQTGQIPSWAQSITYWGDALRVTFNGELLPFNAISNAANYTIWGADISAYAGQTGELLFNAPWQNWAMLDNIRFSSTVVPEPGEIALASFSALLLGLGARFAPTARHGAAARNGRPPRN